MVHINDRRRGSKAAAAAEAAEAKQHGEAISLGIQVYIMRENERMMEGWRKGDRYTVYTWLRKCDRRLRWKERQTEKERLIEVDIS